MAIRATSHAGSLARPERIWGYLFIAAPMLGFLIFTAGPLLASIFISLSSWDLLTPPKWVGAQNWERALSLTIAETPPERDPETGEALYRCGREIVPESRIGEYIGQIDPRSNLAIACEPRFVRPTEVLPDGFRAWFDFQLVGKVFAVGARDPVLWESLFNTVFLLFGVPISMIVSLMLAIALNQRIRGASVFRAIYYLPVILPIAATALIWLWVFNPDFGLLNYVLGQLGLPANTNWLQDRATVKPALIIMGTWGGLGFQMLIYLAGLQGIPPHLYEAAELDGAGTWSKFRHITWPSLSPTTFFLLITGLIGGFQNFIQPYIMTQGGPGNASRTVVMLIYENAFRDLQMGEAATQSWMLGSVIMLITVINFVLARRWVFYEGGEE